MSGSGGGGKGDPKSLALQGLKHLEILIFDTGSSGVTPFGFTRDTPAALHTGRPEVGPGPLESRGHDQSVDNHRYKSLNDIPMRFMTRKCRTALATPSTFSLADIEKSAKEPSYECIKDHILGMKCDLNSGNAIQSFPGFKNISSVSF